MEGVKVTTGRGRKTKKKKVKDEFDPIKQAEKKKRRLEKALATSAAIRLELEKKKQKKKEQERLDEEGAAAIAEAVALRVLIGEDSDETMLNKEGQTSSDYRQQHLGYRLDQPTTYLHDPWSLWGSCNLTVSSSHAEDWGSVGASADHLAALQIVDDAYAINPG